jgi:hypothetical protein
MKIRILEKGDKVINITSQFIAILRANGEVDIMPICIDALGVRIDDDKKITVAYDNNESL